MEAIRQSDLRVQEGAYLQQLESLRQEMCAAMLAISGNSLRALEESLWRQEVLCVSLKRLLLSMQLSRMNGAALSRIQSATTALYTLNQTYAELVQQSRRSADLLHGLCRSYKDASPREADRRNVGQRYSLEA